MNTLTDMLPLFQQRGHGWLTRTAGAALVAAAFISVAISREILLLLL